MESRMDTDVLIVGAGAAGLFCSLHLPAETNVLVVDKGARGRGSSPWAQGGVAAAVGPEDSPELHAQDTSRVAAGHADESAVAVLCDEAPECVLELAELGCAFDRNNDGSLHLAREGGQTVARSAHAGDATGAAIMDTLRDEARSRVKRIEASCVALAVADGRCVGGWLLAAGQVVEVRANSVVLATGGLGGLFESTTNPSGATGEGIVLAWEAGAGLADLEFVQFHPTALAVGTGPQRPLITEALRGAGAHVVDAEGTRFLFEHHSDGELAPRDVVARAISARQAWLDCRHLDHELLEKEFFTVMRACRANGIDPFTDLLPIAPAAHYSIGGVHTDLDGRSSIPRLYSIGECSNTGAHGANRLAGNSLAEALVFGRRAARAIAGQRTGRVKGFPAAPEVRPAGTLRVDDWENFRNLCSSSLGIERTPQGLSRAADVLNQMSMLPLTGDPGLGEFRAAGIAARLLTRSATLRTESRGVHHRTDHPDPDPAWAGVRLRLARNQFQPRGA
ncbi:MAG TPA: FAD-dependent oxidoreductase [Actinomycetota bacterium]|nr:FAD-dependent oxidoreductase [Actinomycetota bacterium]